MESPHFAPNILSVIGLKVKGLPWKEGEPIAAIVAVPCGEGIATKARTCIFVFREPNGDYVFADGVIGLKDKCVVARSDRPWPELYKALEKVPRDYSGLVNTAEDEPPYLRVKNLQETGYIAQPPLGEGRSARALKILSCWNRWNGEPAVDWRNRLYDLDSAAFLKTKTPKYLDSKADALRKECGSLGLKSAQKIDFYENYRQLLVCLSKLKERE